MSIPSSTPSARETLSKIADELQERVRQAGVKAVEDAMGGQPVITAAPRIDAPQAPVVTSPVAVPPMVTAPAVAPLVESPLGAPSIAPPSSPQGPATTSFVIPARDVPEAAAPEPAPAKLTRAQKKAARRAARQVSSERSGARLALLTYFPMFIATISIGLLIYQGYLFHQSTDLMQRNVGRAEYSRACRDIIETYFQVKQKVSVLMPAADRGNVAGASRYTESARLDAQTAIAKFGGLATYLANSQNDATRASYTELTRTLTRILDNARSTQLATIDKTFEPADKLFTQLNDDCVKTSRGMRI